MKKYDLAVVIGNYTNAQGETKKRYFNIGSVQENDKGMFMFINRSFNPAGIPFKEGSESIIVSMFEPKKSDTAKQVENAFSDDDVVF